MLLPLVNSPCTATGAPSPSCGFPGYGPREFVPHWLQVILNYRVAANEGITIWRCLAIVLAIVLIYFGTDRRWAIGFDRRVIFGLFGGYVLLQEGNQVAFNAPWLVWRLPFLTVIELAMLARMVYIMRLERARP